MLLAYIGCNRFLERSTKYTIVGTFSNNEFHLVTTFR